MSEVHRMLELSVKLEALISQIENNDYTDSEGHELKMNRAYLELKKLCQ